MTMRRPLPLLWVLLGLLVAMQQAVLLGERFASMPPAAFDTVLCTAHLSDDPAPAPDPSPIPRWHDCSCCGGCDTGGVFLASPSPMPREPHGWTLPNRGIVSVGLPPGTTLRDTRVRGPPSPFRA